MVAILFSLEEEQQEAEEEEAAFMGFIEVHILTYKKKNVRSKREGREGK